MVGQNSGALKQLSTAVLLTALFLQPACIWRLWSKKPIGETTFDVKGAVVLINEQQLVIRTKKGLEHSFTLVASSIRGSDFEPDTYVHVYYKKEEGVDEVTMVVRIVK